MAEAATIGMIGSGNMASAMVEGWVRGDAARAQRILVTDRGSGRAARLAELHGVTRVDSNDELVARADIVFLAVKPIDVERVLRGVAARITPSKAVASVAAGVQTVTIESVLEGTVPVFRLMPNVGVQVCAGTICFAPGRFTNTDAEQRVLDWLGLLGAVVPLAESQFDAATALSGSGPAFLALLLEAFEDAGIVAGLSHRAARQLILSTAIGTARLLDEKELACSDLRRMVMSPGGTSAAGLHHLESAGVRGSIIGAVVAAMERARELG